MTKKEGYRKALYSYGFITLCYLIDQYECEENFEECQIILDAIKEHNLKMSDSLPTKYDETAKEYFSKVIKTFNLSGSYILNNIEGYIYDIKKLISTCHDTGEEIY